MSRICLGFLARLWSGGAPNVAMIALSDDTAGFNNDIMSVEESLE